MPTAPPTFPHAAAARWSTACASQTGEATALELLALGEHLALCRGQRGRWFAVRLRAGEVHGFMVSRTVSTLLLLTLGLGLLLA
jgi:hypothetical protein